MNHLLSILVVALNEADHLPLLMEHVKRLHRPHGWSIETILVDGGSRDQSLEIARAIGFTRIIQLPGASIPVSRNRALREAAGDMLAFLDGDCLPDRDWLEKAAPYLTADEPVLLGFPVHPARDGNWIQQAWYAHWRHKNTAAQLQAQMPFEEGAFRLITTRNMLLNRRLLDLVPAFNETLTTGEDTDFAFRASEAGAHLLALPTLIVTHLGEPSTLGQYFRQQLWHANRKAYATILRSSGGKRGANAIFFSLAFLLSLLLALAALIATAILRTPWPLLGLLPLAAVTAAPALLIALRAHSPLLFFRLCVLYFLYGFARSVDLVGLAPDKPSWKSALIPPTADSPPLFHNKSNDNSDNSSNNSDNSKPDTPNHNCQKLS